MHPPEPRHAPVESTRSVKPHSEKKAKAIEGARGPSPQPSSATILSRAYYKRKEELDTYVLISLTTAIILFIAIIIFGTIITVDNASLPIVALILTKYSFLTPLIIGFWLAWRLFCKLFNLSVIEARKATDAATLGNYVDLARIRQSDHETGQFAMGTLTDQFREPASDKSRTKYVLGAALGKIPGFKVSAEETPQTRDQASRPSRLR